MASKRLEKAKELLVQGKANKALKFCNKVLSSKPDSYEALALKGDCFSCLFDFKKALNIMMKH